MKELITYLLIALSFSVVSGILMRFVDDFLKVQAVGRPFARSLSVAVKMVMGATFLAIIIWWFM